MGREETDFSTYRLFAPVFWEQKSSQWIRGLAFVMVTGIWVSLTVSASNFLISTRMFCRTDIGDFKSISEMMSNANGGIGTQFLIIILGVFGEEEREGTRLRRSWMEVSSSISFQGGGEKVVGCSCRERGNRLGR